MKILLTVWIATCIAALSLNAEAGKALSKRPVDEAAIKAQLDAYAAARVAGPGMPQALFYTEDADEWGSFAKEMTVGREALAKTLDVKPDPNRKFRLEVISLNFLGKDIALADALYYGASPEPGGHALYVMAKRDGKWLIRSARINRMPAK
jgi:hypothetical protein